VCQGLRLPDGFQPDLARGLLDFSQYAGEQGSVMRQVAPFVACGDLRFAAVSLIGRILDVMTVATRALRRLLWRKSQTL
jgi:hypothetical protein